MKPHRFDWLSLTFGLVFLIAVGWWLFGKAIHVALPELGWFAAGALIIFGVLGLFGALRGDSRKSRRRSEEDDFMNMS